jgi:hypothetical protein
MRLFENRDHEFYQSYFREPGRAEAELEADVHASIVGLFNSGFGNPCPGPPSSVAQASASRNRLPAGVALRHIRIVACRIPTVIPGLRGVGLAVAIIAIVWGVIPSIGILIETEP